MRPAISAQCSGKIKISLDREGGSGRAAGLKPMKNTLALLSSFALATAGSHGAIVWSLGDRDTPGRGAGNNDIRNFYGPAGNVFFAQETGVNALPGNPSNAPVNREADDDYYFAGIYTNQVDGGPAYTPVGVVAQHEATLERAVTNGDGANRFHFNFSSIHTTQDTFTVSFGMIDLDQGGGGTSPGQYDFEVLVNGVSLATFSHGPGTINTDFTTPSFTLGDVNGTAGAPDDNYVELISSNPGTTARWSNFDYIRMDYTPVPEPGTSLLALFGGFGLLALRRRKR